MMLAKLRPWLLPIGLFLGLATLAFLWNREHNGRKAAERDRERLQLQLDGIPVGDPASKKDMEAAIRKIDDLNALVEALRKELPKGTKPTSTSTGTTGTLPATGLPRPDSTTPVKCLLAEGDAIEVQVDNATLETPAGNVIFTGVAACYRTLPTPKTLLGKGEVKYTSLVEPEELKLGWGAGGMAAGGKFGWAIGPALAFPPVNIFGANLEVTTGIGFGPNGEWTASLVGIVRWR